MHRLRHPRVQEHLRHPLANAVTLRSERRLLLHKAQMHKLQAHVTQKGHTLIPLAVYFRNGWAKCELAAAIGKSVHDKREGVQKREQQRDMARQTGRRGRG